MSNNTLYLFCRVCDPDDSAPGRSGDTRCWLGSYGPSYSPSWQPPQEVRLAEWFAEHDHWQVTDEHKTTQWGLEQFGLGYEMHHCPETHFDATLDNVR